MYQICQKKNGLGSYKPQTEHVGFYKQKETPGIKTITELFYLPLSFFFKASFLSLTCFSVHLSFCP